MRLNPCVPGSLIALEARYTGGPFEYANFYHRTYGKAQDTEVFKQHGDQISPKPLRTTQ
jgi:hypothetical protein